MWKLYGQFYEPPFKRGPEPCEVVGVFKSLCRLALALPGKQGDQRSLVKSSSARIAMAQGTPAAKQIIAGVLTESRNLEVMVKIILLVGIRAITADN